MIGKTADVAPLLVPRLRIAESLPILGSSKIRAKYTTNFNPFGSSSISID